MTDTYVPRHAILTPRTGQPCPTGYHGDLLTFPGAPDSPRVRQTDGGFCVACGVMWLYEEDSRRTRVAGPYSTAYVYTDVVARAADKHKPYRVASMMVAP